MWIRRFVVLLVAMLPAVASMSCDDGSETPKKPVGGQLIASDLQRTVAPQLLDGELEALSAGNNQFAFELYASIVAEEEGNVFTSPFSISMALAMTYGGARGNTAVEMAEALHFELDQERLHNAFNALEQQLQSPGAGLQGGFELHIANNFWAALGMSFVDSFLDLLAVNYGAGVRVLDFVADPEAARSEINGWVAEQTKDRVLDLLPAGSITADVAMVLTNAIYFYADWSQQFDKNSTYSRDFTLLDGSKKSVDMMHQAASFRYYRAPHYQALELPYKGGELAMLVLLPDELGSFEGELNPTMLGELDGLLDATTVELALPKFEFEAELALRDILLGLGMVDAFGNADFSGLSEASLAIAQVYHKAFVRVDEKGTEAAAATAVVGDLTALIGERMELNRPFVFMIRDRKSGSILFLGRVVEP